MEQIIRKDGRIFYGEIRCSDADDAYCRFRADYHASIGREAFLRLNRLGQRTERIHGYGFDFVQEQIPVRREVGRIKAYMLGLVGTSYCRGVGRWDLPCEALDDDSAWEFIDWIFSRRSGALRTVGIKDKSGRTSKRLNTRYR